jgi:hypothetical protein
VTCDAPGHDSAKRLCTRCISRRSLELRLPSSEDALSARSSRPCQKRGSVANRKASLGPAKPHALPDPSQRLLRAAQLPAATQPCVCGHLQRLSLSPSRTALPRLVRFRRSGREMHDATQGG